MLRKVVYLSSLCKGLSRESEYTPHSVSLSYFSWSTNSCKSNTYASCHMASYLLAFAFLCHVEMKGPKHIMHHVIGDGDDYVRLDSFIIPWGFVSYVLLD